MEGAQSSQQKHPTVQCSFNYDIPLKEHVKDDHEFYKDTPWKGISGRLPKQGCLSLLNSIGFEVIPEELAGTVLFIHSRKKVASKWKCVVGGALQSVGRSAHSLSGAKE